MNTRVLAFMLFLMNRTWIYTDYADLHRSETLKNRQDAKTAKKDTKYPAK